MVSYKKVTQEDEENVLFEAPSHGISHNDDIELNDINTTGPQQQLLSSFDRDSYDDDDGDDDDVLTHGSKDSDDRLTSNQHENEIHRSIQNNAFNNNNSNGNNISNTGSSSSNSNETNIDQRPLSSMLSSPSVTINSLRTNFNFLDRLFKKKYTQGERIGQGSENDGVFSNLSAKPDVNPQVDSDKPPTYEEASADATPPYWENSVLAPGFGEEIFVDGLPVGNIVNFVWNLMVSSSFQFVGFLLTYILHTSHAAKHGSRAGLGITFITYGFGMIPKSDSFERDNAKIAESKIQPTDTSDYNIGSDSQIEGALDAFHSSLSSGSAPASEEATSATMIWLSYSVIAFGVFLIIKAFVNYHRAKKMEEIILQPPSVPSATSAEEQV